MVPAVCENGQAGGAQKENEKGHDDGNEESQYVG
jgi:hypothetical protein